MDKSVTDKLQMFRTLELMVLERTRKQMMWEVVAFTGEKQLERSVKFYYLCDK